MQGTLSVFADQRRRRSYELGMLLKLFAGDPRFSSTGQPRDPHIRNPSHMQEQHLFGVFSCTRECRRRARTSRVSAGAGRCFGVLPEPRSLAHTQRNTGDVHAGPLLGTHWAAAGRNDCDTVPLFSTPCEHPRSFTATSSISKCLGRKGKKARSHRHSRRPQRR